MAMQVETFEVTEITSDLDAPRPDEAQIALIEKLGLKGQEDLVVSNGVGGKEVSPYRQMTRVEFLTYSLLLDGKIGVEAFKESAIPLRVLQVLEHAKSLGRLTHFYVWYEASINVKDPLLVARENNETWKDDGWTILARWGNELRPFEQMKEMAAKKAKVTVIDEAKKVLSKVQRYIAEAEGMSDEHFLGAGLPVVYHVE